MTVGGLYLLVVLAAFGVLWLAFKYAAWETWDDYRRLERRAHLNLQKQSGGWEL